MNDYEELSKDILNNSGLEFYDSSTNNLLKLEAPIHPEIPNYSELAFYLTAVENENALEHIEKITQIAIRKNKPRPIWMNEEIQMGLSAAFALAFKDKKYIANFVNVLRTFDLDHGVYEDFFIELLLKKWETCDEMLFLIAAKSGSIMGQWGIENFEIPKLDHEQKSKFMKYLLEDTLKSKVVHSDLLIDALAILDISIDIEKFKKLFEHYKPLFNEATIPSLSPIE
jgi:hypothetical protein